MDSPTLNMVQNQIAPNGVTHEGVLDAFLALDRAHFIPATLSARAYADDTIAGEDGQVLLLRPLILALMIQHVARRDARGKIALVGDPSGYAAEILHKLGFTSVSVEDDTALSGGAPWQAILLNGSVEEIPSFLFAHLEDEGEVLAVVQKGAIGNIVAAKAPNAKTILGQASAPLLPGFAAKKEFAL